MNDKQTNSLIRLLYNVSAILVLVGAFFRIQHDPYGALIVLIGFLLGTFTSVFDNFRLKKKIKQLEEQIAQKEQTAK